MALDNANSRGEDSLGDGEVSTPGSRAGGNYTAHTTDLTKNMTTKLFLLFCYIFWEII